ncbi:MAG: TIGR03790 family protein [Desulfobulbaceae bacterium]|nr:TIGR03790 family protein [Desulfobulbaceae bacterium]
MPAFLSFVILLGALFAAAPGYGLTAGEIAVVANKQQPDSLSLARFYMDQRRIPAANLITIDIDPAEDCRRSDYDNLIAKPVYDFLNKEGRQGKVRCLVTMYGVPLKISTPALSDQGSETIAQLTKKIEEITLSLANGKDESVPDILRGKISDIKKQINYYTKVNDMRAAVDSELTLVLQTHPLAHWLPNPYYRDQQGEFLPFGQKEVLMVSRLDASSPELVRRMITDTLAAEKEGLHGEAFFDARWPDPGLKQVDSYGWYDRAIHRAADVVRQSGRMDKVIVDEQSALFQPGVRRDAALYCGWYSLAKYIDAFTWQQGAVGYHIASSECSTLKKEGSQVWCKRMLEKGVAATIGPVGEPYVNAFPPPDLFFAFLMGGKNLVESYFFSLPHLSWKMVLIGDPLYTPFAAAPESHGTAAKDKGSY